MNFREKIRRLVGTRNKSELSRSAGLPDTAIDAVVNKGREPLVTNAIRLAKVLGVSSDWLFDDLADWPPPKEFSVESLAQTQLVDELARRRELVRKDMRNIIAEFSGERLIHLERLSIFKPRNAEQKAELDTAMELLFRAEMLSRMLLWLDPDETHPPTLAVSPQQILGAYPYLHGKFNALLAERIGNSLGTPAMFNKPVKHSDVPRYDMNTPGTFPENATTAIKVPPHDQFATSDGLEVIKTVKKSANKSNRKIVDAKKQSGTKRK